MSAVQLPDESTCLYRFKQCQNPRAVKKDGMPHKLCEYHRARAKAHQKQHKIRQDELKARQLEAESAGDSRRLTFEDIVDVLDREASLNVTCSEEELKAIEAMLSGSETEE